MAETQRRGLGTETITLDELLHTAMESNPAIQASRHSVEAKKAVISSAKTLPDPTITTQSMGQIIPGQLMKGDPSSAHTLGVEQEIPFPGKLELKGKMASLEAEAEEWNHTQTTRQVVSDLKEGYYDLFVIHKSVDTVNKSKDLLQNLQEIAATKYKVGQGIQQDVLKGQVEISKLMDRLIVLDQRRIVTEAQINALLNRPPESPLGKPEEFPKAELRFSLEELTGMAQANSPAVKIQDREVDRKQVSVQVAQKEYYPDFSVGFTYYNREANPDMYAWMAKVKVPLYFWRKQRPELDAAKLNLAGSQRARESVGTSVASQIRQNYTIATTSERLAKLYASVVVPQAGLSLKSATANYQVGKSDFLTLTDSVLSTLEFQLKYYEALGDYQKALARMEPLVGVELTR